LAHQFSSKKKGRILDIERRVNFHYLVREKNREY
jgi:hypothetical protein